MDIHKLTAIGKQGVLNVKGNILMLFVKLRNSTKLNVQTVVNRTPQIIEDVL